MQMMVQSVSDSGESSEGSTARRRLVTREEVAETENQMESNPFAMDVAEDEKMCAIECDQKAYEGNLEEEDE